MPDQVRHDLEDLRLDGYAFTGDAQLERVGIELGILEAVTHADKYRRRSPWSLTDSAQGYARGAGTDMKEFTMTDLWSYRIEIDTVDLDLDGFDVEASDGHIGKVDEWSATPGDSYLVVDTGFWIFGKKRVVPARAIKQVNVDDEKVFVDMTKEQIRDAPDHHVEWTQAEQREPFVGYYSPMNW